mmetsp:Transcript_44617/g.129797  ORF Transcript_44617/g.129797 Transcript_44617/m.129797 type:complete len:407 (+) Transcript_44617:1244-2464(+)
MVEQQSDLVGQGRPLFNEGAQPLPVARLVGAPLALEEFVRLLLRKTGTVAGAREVAVQHACEVHPKLVHRALVRGFLEVQLPCVEVVLEGPLDRCADLLLRLLLRRRAESWTRGARLEILLEPRYELVAQAGERAGELEVGGLEVQPRGARVHPRDEAVDHPARASVEAGLGAVRLAAVAAGAVEGHADGAFRDVGELPPELDFVDGAVVEELLAELVQGVPNGRGVVVPSRQRIEFGRPGIPAALGVLAEPAEDLASEVEDLAGEELARPTHLLPAPKFGGDRRREQEDRRAVQEDEVLQRRAERAGHVLQMVFHLLQHVLVHGFRAVVLVPQDEGEARLHPREAEVAHREQAHLEQVLELPGKFALVVHEDQVAASHAHQCDLSVENAALGAQRQETFGVENQH